MTWIGSFVTGWPWWMPANQVNWKVASGDMTESTDGSSYVSFHNLTLKATSSGGLEAIPTSKIEKERRRNTLRNHDPWRVAKLSEELIRGRRCGDLAFMFGDVRLSGS